MTRILLFAFVLMLNVSAYATEASVEESLIETVHKSESAKQQETTTPSELRAKVREAAKARAKAKAEATGKAGTQAKPKRMPAKKQAAKPAAPSPEMQVIRNIAYGDDPAQTLDVYAPYGSGAAPVIVVLQSPNWVKDEKENPVSSATKIQHWTGKGLLFVSLRTRMLPEASVRDEAEDIARAVFYLKDNLKRLGGDPDHIVVIGYDAGAHILMLSASDPAINRGVMWQGSIALDSPVFDVGGLMRWRPLPMHQQVFGSDPDTWPLLSPYSRINAQTMPSLLVCPGQVRDGCAQAEKYQTKSQRLGNIVQILPAEKDHAQINTDLGASGAYTDAVDAFLKQVGVLP